MKIKPDTIGFTENKFRAASEALTWTGIIASGVGVIMTAVGRILHRKSATWFLTANEEQQDYLFTLYKDFDSGAD